MRSYLAGKAEIHATSSFCLFPSLLHCLHFLSATDFTPQIWNVYFHCHENKKSFQSTTTQDSEKKGWSVQSWTRFGTKYSIIFALAGFSSLSLDQTGSPPCVSWLLWQRANDAFIFTLKNFEKAILCFILGSQVSRTKGKERKLVLKFKIYFRDWLQGSCSFQEEEWSRSKYLPIMICRHFPEYLCLCFWYMQHAEGQLFCELFWSFSRVNIHHHCLIDLTVRLDAWCFTVKVMVWTKFTSYGNQMRLDVVRICLFCQFIDDILNSIDVCTNPKPETTERTNVHLVVKRK